MNYKFLVGQTCSLFNFRESGSVAYIAGAPAGPVYISTLCASPILGRKETSRLLCRVLPDLDADLFLVSPNSSLKK